MIAAWGEGKQGLEAIRRVAADHREAATPVVVRACQDFLIRGHRAPLAWLRELRDSITDIEALMHLADAMPRATTELRETALEVEQAIAGAAAALVERDAGEAAKALRAKALNNLSVRLADLGRREAALTAIAEAVATYRTLAQARPDAFLPDLPPVAEQPVKPPRRPRPARGGAGGDRGGGGDPPHAGPGAARRLSARPARR